MNTSKGTRNSSMFESVSQMALVLHECRLWQQSTVEVNSVHYMLPSTKVTQISSCFLYTHPSQSAVIPAQVWSASIDGSMLLYLTTAGSRIVLGLLSVGADHTWAGISALGTGACTGTYCILNQLQSSKYRLKQRYLQALQETRTDCMKPCSINE